MEGSDDNDKNMPVENSDKLLEEGSKIKKRKPGIVYFSSIPQHMNTDYVRRAMSEFGEVGRVYFQQDLRDMESGKKKKKAHSQKYSEGWVEFKSKRVAKEVVRILNNTQIGGKKNSKFYDHIWTLKYLPRFKWTHLSERLAYEKAVHKQRMRVEIYQAKREADYFSLNIDKSEKLKKKKSKGEALKPFIPQVQIKQRDTEDQILGKKNSSKNVDDGSADDRDSFLKSLFS